jgi:hypothetical protein
MKKIFVIALVSVAAAWGVPHPANAQQKTEKACQEEWRANKAANQEAKITEKAYVDKCRGTAAKPEAAKTPAAAPAAPAPTAVKPVQAPTSTAAKPEASKPAAAKPEAAKPAAVTPAGKNQFATEALAKGHCPADTVVYLNLKSDIYHFAGSKDYGKLKDGTFMCEKDTAGAGARAAKNEKHP